MPKDQEFVRLQRRSDADPVDDEAALRRVLARVRAGQGRLLELPELRTILIRAKLYYRTVDGRWYSDRLYENAGVVEPARVAEILGVSEALVRCFERAREGGIWRPDPRTIVDLFELAERLRRLDDEVLELDGLDLTWYFAERRDLAAAEAPELDGDPDLSGDQD